MIDKKRYCSSIEFVSVPRTVPYFFDHIFESKFSKTTRQKFKANIFSERVNLALSESFLTFDICRVVFENFELEKLITVRFGYGDKFGEITVNIFFFI